MFDRWQEHVERVAIAALALEDHHKRAWRRPRGEHPRMRIDHCKASDAPAMDARQSVAAIGIVEHSAGGGYLFLRLRPIHSTRSSQIAGSYAGRPLDIADTKHMAPL